MKISHRVYLAFLYLFLLSKTVIAQSIQEDLERLYKQYESIDNIYMELESKTYQKDKVTIQQTGKIYKQGGNYFYDTKEAAMLVNHKFIIMVDYNGHNIICNDWSKEKAKKLAEMPIPSINDLLTRYPKISFKGITNNSKHYIVENDKLQINRMEIFFEQSTGLVKRVIYHYNKVITGDNDVRMELNLKVINLKATFEESTFSEKKFIIEENKILKVASRYQNYTLRDFRIKK